VNRRDPSSPINRPRKRAVLAGTRQRCRRRCLPTALAAFGSALVLAACGGSSKPSGTSPSSANKGSPSSYAKSQLAAAACIRKHGVPDMPDPTFGAGGAQVNLHMPVAMGSSPAFARAQKECAKLGLELAGYAEQRAKPTAAEMSQWLAIARCMRAHGVPNFPDPVTTLPPDPATYPARYSAAFNINGVDWAIPKSIDLQAPAVKQAATACGPNATALTAP
jgi:hypothetical protein